MNGHIDLMKPRTRNPFGPGAAVIPAGYDHHRVTAEATVSDNVPVGNLRVTPGIPFDASLSRHYPGTLTNNNSFALRDAEVVVTLYGVVNAGFDFPSTPIAAGATVDFDIVVSDHYSGVNRYVFQAQGQ